MAVYFKFKSRKDFECVSIDMNWISVGELRNKIMEKMGMRCVRDLNARKKSTRRGDVLVISNWETKEDYLDDSFMMSKYTSVSVSLRPLGLCLPIVLTEEQKPLLNVRRPPLQCFPIVLTDKQKPALEVPPVYSAVKTFESSQKNTLHVNTPGKTFESSRKNNLRFNTPVKTFESLQNTVPYEGYVCRRCGVPGHFIQHCSLNTVHVNTPVKTFESVQNTVPYEGYVCRRCGVPGHFIQYCPTNGDPAFGIIKVRPQIGIPC